MPRFCLRISLTIIACFFMSSAIAQSFFDFSFSNTKNNNPSPATPSTPGKISVPRVHVMSPEEFSTNAQKMNQQVNNRVQDAANKQIQKQSANAPANVPISSTNETSSVTLPPPTATVVSPPPPPPVAQPQPVQTNTNYPSTVNPPPTYAPPPTVNQPQSYSGFGTTPPPQQGQAPRNNSQGNSGGWNIKY